MIRLHALVFALLCAICSASDAADPAKVLRLATSDIDTLDPHQWQDAYSRDVGSSIFEALYEWNYLARPPSPSPDTAAGQPEVSADGKTWTIRLKPGIYFTEDPAFRGKRRELVAEDYVYSIKRYLDPNLRGGGEPLLTDLVVGMRPVVDAARMPGAKFDYDARVEGLRALDRHTLQLRFNDVDYPSATDLLFVRAVAREVVEAAKGDIQARPVGTGPYRLKEWQRGTRIVLEAVPGYRTLTFPESADPAHAALERSMKGKRLPQIGRVELSVIDEQPVRLLEFDGGKLDYIELRGEAVARLLRNGELDPALAARGIRRIRYSSSSVRSIYINMDDPVVGGMGNDRVALRRAVALAIDVDSLIRVVYSGQGTPMNQVLVPGVSGHDPDAKKRPFDPVAAQALLDRFGYAKRDAQGYRLAPNGAPLALTLTIFTGNVWREIQTLLHKNMDAIGLRMEFRVVPVQDLFKENAQGKFALNIHGRGQTPNGLAFAQFYGPAPPETNETRFRSADYDTAFRNFLRATTPAQRLAEARRMIEIVQTFVPMIPLLVDIDNAFVQPWVQGYFPSTYATFYKYMDIASANK
ncbi:MAG: ABC transporter substrate-binding protein [Casimicrobiaceae bacterium]